MKLKKAINTERICYICDMGIASKDIPILVNLNKVFYFCCQECKDVFYDTMSLSIDKR